MEIIKVVDAEDILGLLLELEPEMPRLIQKVGNLSLYAQKLAEQACCIVLKNNEENLGTVIFYQNDLKSYVGFITLIIVKEKYRGLKLGRLLLEEAFKEMRSNHMKTVRLAIDRNNTNAREFYYHMGFCKDEEENQYGPILVKELS